MAIKGKEPAGLRRYRLAQKAKKNKRKVSTMVRRTPRRRAAGTRRMRRGRKSFKPSLLTLAGAGYSVYNAYKEAQKAGTEKGATFLWVLTGVGLGRYAVDGKPTFNSKHAMTSATPIVAGAVASKGLNYFKTSKYAFKKIPFVGRKFKW